MKHCKKTEMFLPFVRLVLIASLTTYSLPYLAISATTEPDDARVVRDYHLSGGVRPGRDCFLRLRERARENPEDAEPLMALARIYSDREFGEYNPERVQNLIDRAAGLGLDDACIAQLAISIRSAKTPQDAQSSIQQLQFRATNNGSAGYVLGQLYAIGAPELPKSPSESVKFLKYAADHRIVEAWKSLGEVYENEMNDNATAWGCYCKAAELNSPSACVLVAQRYRLGEGVAKDPDAALKWMRKAAEVSPDAIAYLAEYYADGVGIPSDLASARGFARQSADVGSASGAKLLSEVYLEDKFGGIYDKRLGLHWLTISAERGSPEGLALLGVLNLTGIGTRRDLDQSEKLFEQAKSYGIGGSAEKLVELMLAAAYDPDKTQSAFDEISRLRDGNSNASMSSALLLLTGHLKNDHGMKSQDLLSETQAAGDPIAKLLLRLLADEETLR